VVGRCESIELATDTRRRPTDPQGPESRRCDKVGNLKRDGSLQERPAYPGVFDPLRSRSGPHLRVQPEQRSRGNGSRRRSHGTGGEIPGEAKAQESNDRGSAKPRNAGTASRREKNPVDGFPRSFVASLTWFLPRNLHSAPRTRGVTAHLGAPPHHRHPVGRSNDCIGRDSVEDVIRTLHARPKGTTRRYGPSAPCLANRHGSWKDPDSREWDAPGRGNTRQEGTRPRKGYGSPG